MPTMPTTMSREGSRARAEGGGGGGARGRGGRSGGRGEPLGEAALGGEARGRIVRRGDERAALLRLGQRQLADAALRIADDGVEEAAEMAVHPRDRRLVEERGVVGDAERERAAALEHVEDQLVLPFLADRLDRLGAEGGAGFFGGGDAGGSRPLLPRED